MSPLPFHVGPPSTATIGSLQREVCDQNLRGHSGGNTQTERNGRRIWAVGV